MSSSIAEIFGVPAMRELRETAPNVHCQVDVFVAPDLLRRLQDGGIDLCIQVFQPGVWEQISDIEAISHKALFSDNYVLVGDASNRLLTDEMDFDTFCRIDHVETRFGGNLMSLPERSLASLSMRPKTPLIVPTYNLAIAAVLGSSMTAIVPSRVANAPWLEKKLVIVKPPFEIGPLEQHMIWHKRNENDPGHTWFRRFLQDFASLNMSTVT